MMIEARITFLEQRLQRVEEKISMNNHIYPDFSNGKDIEDQYESVLLSLLIWGEARNQPIEGKIAVGNVALNRAAKAPKYGKDLSGVIIKPQQFSCFNKTNVNRKKMKLITFPDETYDICCDVAEKLICRIYKDNTEGATHYWNPLLANPGWSKKMKLTVKIKDHQFAV